MTIPLSAGAVAPAQSGVLTALAGGNPRISWTSCACEVTLAQLLTRRNAVDYVLLEASGVADPEGIVYAADCPDKCLALQAVGRRTEISELDEWGERTRPGR